MLPPLAPGGGAETPISAYAHSVIWRQASHRRLDGRMGADSGVWAPLGKQYQPLCQPELDLDARFKARASLLEQMRALDADTPHAAARRDFVRFNEPPPRKNGRDAHTPAPTRPAGELGDGGAPTAPTRGAHARPVGLLDAFDDGPMYARDARPLWLDSRRLCFPPQVLRTSHARVKQVGAGTAYRATIFTFNAQPRLHPAAGALPPIVASSDDELPRAPPLRPSAGGAGAPLTSEALRLVSPWPWHARRTMAAGVAAAGAPRSRQPHERTERGRGVLTVANGVACASCAPRGASEGGAVAIGRHADARDLGVGPGTAPRQPPPPQPPPPPPPPLAARVRARAPAARPSASAFLAKLSAAHARDDLANAAVRAPPAAMDIPRLAADFARVREERRSALDATLVERQMLRADVFSLPAAQARVGELVAARPQATAAAQLTRAARAGIGAPAGRSARPSVWHAISTELADRDGGELRLWQTLVTLAVDDARAAAGRARAIREGELEVAAPVGHGWEVAAAHAEAAQAPRVGPDAAQPDERTQAFLRRLHALLLDGARAASPLLTATLGSEFGMEHALIRKLLLAACAHAGMGAEHAATHLSEAGAAAAERARARASERAPRRGARAARDEPKALGRTRAQAAVARAEMRALARAARAAAAARGAAIARARAHALDVRRAGTSAASGGVVDGQDAGERPLSPTEQLRFELGLGRNPSPTPTPSPSLSPPSTGSGDGRARPGRACSRGEGTAPAS
ncbi:hypothetical protein KFE25_000967 [Diacronema lutheri]|uniref:Uncharacterized protein n=1 Tax=Diacronema lutheri TaxID=2081491 RepID=A0A8J5X316_DIALT|nr:hypothetical protein KFE25_000967 [Diacronema lutheri]